MPLTKPSSFIPKRSFAAIPPKKSRFKKRRGAFLTISIVIFIFSIGLAVGSFVYDGIVDSRLEAKKVSLERARESFDTKLIEELRTLSQKMEFAEIILDKHVAVIPFFELVSEITLESTQFRSFDFGKDADGNVEVLMRGVTDSFTSVALQSDVFGENDLIHEPVFSEFKVELTGAVSFSVSAIVDPSLVIYRTKS